MNMRLLPTFPTWSDCDDPSRGKPKGPERLLRSPPGQTPPGTSWLFGEEVHPGEALRLATECSELGMASIGKPFVRRHLSSASLESKKRSP
jgi:hypothetical protein